MALRRFIGDAANDETGCDLRYQGQLYDAESGLSYNRHRYYDPEIGQYISSDPPGLGGGLRPQGYVHNPVEWVDPFGLEKRAPDKTAPGDVKFKKWKRGEAIDKPLPDGRSPSWDTVRSRYWKNRYEASKDSGEFTRDNLMLMKKGNAPLDSTGNPYELHHHIPQRSGGSNVNNPINLREVTREQHAALDPYRHL